MADTNSGICARPSALRAVRSGESGSSENEAAITLGLLDAVHANAQVSQRSLSAELGIALGLTNAYLRRCVRKGLVKVRQAPANRFAYYLTPKGFSEKSRLTARYLSRSLSFYREARNQCDALLDECAARDWNRVALYGVGDLAEIALLCALRHPVEIAGIVDPGAKIALFLNVPVYGALADAGTFDGVLLTDYKRPQISYDALAARVPAANILAPAILKIAAGTGGQS